MFKSAIVSAPQQAQQAPQQSQPQQQQQEQQKKSSGPQSNALANAINVSDARIVSAASPNNPVQTSLRRCEVPFTRLVKVKCGTQTRDQQTGQLVNVSGFRIDEVVDTKLVEVTEQQAFTVGQNGQMIPAAAPQIINQAELGMIPNSRLGCTRGQEVFHPDHPELQGLDEESDSQSAQVTQSPQYAPKQTDSFYKQAPPPRQDLDYNHPLVQSNPGMQPGGMPINRGSYDRSGFGQPRNCRPSGAYHKGASYTHIPRQEGGFAPLSDAKYGQWTDAHSCGLTVKDTTTRHTDSCGVMVASVYHGSPAAKAGVQIQDIITMVNGQKVDTVLEFTDVLQNASGDLLFILNRDGRRNVAVPVYR